MKKTFFALPLLALLMFFGNTSFAQGTTVQTITIRNNTNCTINAQAHGLDSGCNIACSTNLLTIGPNGQITVQFPCGSIDGVTTNVVRVYDPGSGQGASVGNGCGTTPFATYTDCQNILRTTNYVNPGLVTIM